MFHNKIVTVTLLWKRMLFYWKFSNARTRFLFSNTGRSFNKKPFSFRPAHFKHIKCTAQWGYPCTGFQKLNFQPLKLQNFQKYWHFLVQNMRNLWKLIKITKFLLFHFLFAKHYSFHSKDQCYKSPENKMKFFLEEKHKKLMKTFQSFNTDSFQKKSTTFSTAL